MDETTTAPTTSGRAADGGGRIRKMGGQKKQPAQKTDTEKEKAEAGSAAVRRRE